MTATRENILSAIAATLATVDGVSGRIWRSRVDALLRDEAPAIVIEPASDDPLPQQVSTNRIDWRLSVTIAVNVRGNVPDAIASPILADIHARLMADRTLGGWAIDTFPSTLTYALDKADLTSLWAAQTWTIRYRTSITSLELTP